MNLRLVLRVIAFIIIIVCILMLIPAGIALRSSEKKCLLIFFITTAIGVGFSFLSILFTTKCQRDIVTSREGFLIVCIAWAAAAGLGALPFYLSGSVLTYADAFFETMSGFTTTGASILKEIESLPRSLLFWRSLTHWLGGMGIVLLTIVFLPILGVKGLHFIRIEAPGPTVEKIVPRIAETTLVLWLIYLGLTLAETLLLMLGRMNLFDALTHTFGTLATGGFSPKNRSVGHYSSKYVHIIITIFMMLAGTNFNLYYRLLSGRFREIKKNTELRAYLGIFFISSILIALVLNGSVYESFGKSLRYGSFQVASIFTTTGFSTADFDAWPAMAKGILFALMFIGGSSGSTGGGIKVIRIVTLFKIGINEMRYILHPRGVYTVKINDMPVRKDIAYTIAGFVFLYISFLIITTLVVTSGGYDLVTSFSTALVTVGNIGPGFGKIGPTLNYSFYPDYIKWFLSFAMMVGRLEVYTVFIIFTPWFWKR